MSDPDALRSRLIDEASGRIRFYESTHRNVLLLVGLTTRDGDGKEVGAFILRSRLGFIVSDCGDTWNGLYMDSIVRGVPTRTQTRRAKALALGFRVVFDPDTTTLVRRASLNDVVDVVHRICAASIALDAWRFFR